MLSLHILEINNGAESPGGVRGVVVSSSALYYGVLWEDGSATEHEQGDPDVWGFYFPQNGGGGPSGPTYRQIVHDGKQWRKAGPRPKSAPQDMIIPIEADSAAQ